MAELKGGAGQDKAFWEDVALEFNEEEQINYGKHTKAFAFLYRKITSKKLSGLKHLVITKVTSMIFVMEDLSRVTFIFGSSCMTLIS